MKGLLEKGVNSKNIEILTLIGVSLTDVIPWPMNISFILILVRKIYNIRLKCRKTNNINTKIGFASNFSGKRFKDFVNLSQECRL